MASVRPVGDRYAYTAPMSAEQRRWLSALYESNFAAVLKRCGAILKSAEDAADAAHEVFLIALNSLAPDTEEKRARAWLLTVAHNHCLDLLRRRRRLGRALLTLGADPDAGSDLEAGIVDRDFVQGGAGAAFTPRTPGAVAVCGGAPPAGRYRDRPPTELRGGGAGRAPRPAARHPAGRERRGDPDGASVPTRRPPHARPDGAVSHGRGIAAGGAPRDRAGRAARHAGSSTSPGLKPAVTTPAAASRLTPLDGANDRLGIAVAGITGVADTAGTVSLDAPAAMSSEGTPTLKSLADGAQQSIGQLVPSTPLAGKAGTGPSAPSLALPPVPTVPPVPSLPPIGH
ncbi:MAG: hypothetical protein E6J07_06980 [Chloroflexi bacterium]|nr:MAG: hypothetical protein E6J07_06980 [Chloroflexota bacterium]